MNKTPKLPDIDRVQVAADKLAESVKAARQTQREMKAKLGASNG